MNKAMLRESVGQIIRIEPKPRHHEAEVDPDWRVTNADSKGIEITHLGNQQRVRIAFDQIHEYVSPVEGDQRGCLYLYGRIFVGDPHPKLASLSPAERRALYGGRSRAQTAPDLRRSMNLLIAEIGRNKLLRGRMAGWPEHKHLDLMIDRLEKVHGDEEPLATLYTLRQRTQGQRALNEYPQSVGHQHQAHYVPAADDALIALRLFLQRAKPDGFQV
jgi:hypothetical protein